MERSTSFTRQVPRRTEVAVQRAPLAVRLRVILGLCLASWLLIGFLVWII